MNINFRMHIEEGIFFYVFVFCLDSNSSEEDTIQSEQRLAHNSFTFRYPHYHKLLSNRLIFCHVVCYKPKEKFLYRAR